jgi:amino acid permease
MYILQLTVLILDWVSGPAFRTWLYNGALGSLLGFWAACCQPSYLGLEIIGIVAEETERQRETLPSAVRRVAYRGLLYHIGILFVLGLNVSSNDPILKVIVTSDYASPFELMVERAGIPSLKHVINAVTVIAILGAANTRLYVSVSLYGRSTNRSVELYTPLQMRDKLQEFSKRRESGRFQRLVWLSLLFQGYWHFGP